jgi:uncharacterized protein (DUF952 family)
MLEEIEIRQRLSYDTKVLVGTYTEPNVRTTEVQNYLLPSVSITANVRLPQVKLINLMTKLFHITEASHWQAAQLEGRYVAQSLQTVGFIHLSEQDQVQWVGHRFYQGQTGLVLLEIDSTQLKAELRYDEVPGDGTFPHLYGPLNLDAVVEVFSFTPGLGVND